MSVANVWIESGRICYKISKIDTIYNNLYFNSNLYKDVSADILSKNNKNNKDKTKWFLELRSTTIELINTSELLDFVDLMNEHVNVILHFTFNSIDLNILFARLYNVKSLVLISDTTVDYDKIISIFPEKLENLEIKFEIGHEKLLNLPATLKKLSLLDNYDDPLPILPASLQSLTLGENFDQPLDNLPPLLEELYLKGSFDKPLDNLPYNLKILVVNSELFDHNVDNLPYGLQVLKLGHNFTKPLNNLPPNIKELSLLTCVMPNKNRTLNTLPDSIEYLTLNIAYEKIDKMPKNLKVLTYIASDRHDYKIISKLEKAYPNIEFSELNYEFY